MGNIVEIQVKSWRAIYKVVDAFSGYVFRGQAKCEWELLTSLERRLGRNIYYLPLPQNREYWMLHEFKRKFLLYSPNPPDSFDAFEWLAIMQHHGCTTRLLDFTDSLFIAAYFAVIDGETDAAVWAINNWNLRNRLKDYFALPYEKSNTLRDEINLRHIELANRFVGHASLEKCPDYVVSLVPKRSTDRMARQQGLFLMPTNPDSSFMQNLFAAFDIKETSTYSEVSLEDIDPDSFMGYDVVKLVIPATEHRTVLQDLTRMNITAETLFPGLDGFARSLVQTVM